MLNYKSFDYEVKDVDTGSGVVDIYVNAFGNVDSDGDISAPGSFKKTISENFKRIKHLYNHDSRILLGAPLEMNEDPFGLHVLSQTNKEKDIVKDVLSDYRLFKDLGRTIEHSIGFNVMKRDEKNRAIITEYRLLEYSTLSFLGANENTPFNGMKSQECIIKRMQDLVLMYNSSYSDNRLKAIERELETLAKAEPLASTLNDEPNQEAALLQTLKSFRNDLTLI